HGSHGWTTLTIPLVNLIPDKVGYIDLLLGVEGKGVAWFDQLTVRHIDASKWTGAKVIYPKTGATVNTRRPLIKWHSNGASVTEGIYLSKAASSMSSTKLHRTHKRGQYRPARPLSPGKWYWRVKVSPSPQDIQDSVPQSAIHSFIIS